MSPGRIARRRPLSSTKGCATATSAASAQRHEIGPWPADGSSIGMTHPSGVVEHLSELPLVVTARLHVTHPRRDEGMPRHPNNGLATTSTVTRAEARFTVTLHPIGDHHSLHDQPGSRDQCWPVGVVRCELSERTAGAWTGGG